MFLQPTLALDDPTHYAAYTRAYFGRLPFIEIGTKNIISRQIRFKVNLVAIHSCVKCELCDHCDVHIKSEMFPPLLDSCFPYASESALKASSRSETPPPTKHTLVSITPSVVDALDEVNIADEPHANADNNYDNAIDRALHSPRPLAPNRHGDNHSRDAISISPVLLSSAATRITLRGNTPTAPTKRYAPPCEPPPPAPPANSPSPPRQPHAISTTYANLGKATEIEYAIPLLVASPQPPLPPSNDGYARPGHQPPSTSLTNSIRGPTRSRIINVCDDDRQIGNSAEACFDDERRQFGMVKDADSNNMLTARRTKGEEKPVSREVGLIRWCFFVHTT